MAKATYTIEAPQNCIECDLCYHDDYFNNYDDVNTFKCAPRRTHLSDADSIKRNEKCPLALVQEEVEWTKSAQQQRPAINS